MKFSNNISWVYEMFFRPRGCLWSDLDPSGCILSVFTKMKKNGVFSILHHFWSPTLVWALRFSAATSFYFLRADDISSCRFFLRSFPLFTHSSLYRLCAFEERLLSNRLGQRILFKPWRLTFSWSFSYRSIATNSIIVSRFSSTNWLKSRRLSMTFSASSLILKYRSLSLK